VQGELRNDALIRNQKEDVVIKNQRNDAQVEDILKAKSKKNVIAKDVIKEKNQLINPLKMERILSKLQERFNLKEFIKTKVLKIQQLKNCIIILRVITVMVLDIPP
jgi:hypothetical protein